MIAEGSTGELLYQIDQKIWNNTTINDNLSYVINWIA